MTVGAARIGVAEREQARGEAWWMFAAVPMLTAAIGVTWMLREMLQRAYGMTGEAWDLAYDQQVIWNIAQGHGFYTSFARGDFLGIHLEPIFVLLAAIEKFWPSPTVLLIFASAGLAAAAPAAYLFFRAILPAGRAESPWLAVALAAPIPFWAATQEAARDFFHPENMALAFALLAAWAGLGGHGVSMFALPLLAPRSLLPSVPPYLANALSGHNPQNDLHLHYVLLLMFPLLVAGGLGARELLRRRSFKPGLALAVVLPALLLGWGTGRFPPALYADENLYDRPNSVAQLQAAP